MGKKFKKVKKAMLGGIDAYNKFFYAGETLDKESKKINAKYYALDNDKITLRRKTLHRQ